MRRGTQAYMNSFFQETGHLRVGTKQCQVVALTEEMHWLAELAPAATF